MARFERSGPVPIRAMATAQAETLTFESVNQYAAMVDSFAASVAAGETHDAG